jgi:C4-dicarboxylate-specific signal transduction histidine kinase
LPASRLEEGVQFFFLEPACVVQWQAMAPDTPALVKLKQRNFLIGGAILLASAPVESLWVGYVAWGAVWAHVVAAAALGVISLAVGRGLMSAKAGGSLVALVLSLFVPALFYLLGGVHEALLQIVAIIPFTFIVLAPDNRSAAALALAGTFAGAVGIQLLAGASVSRVLFAVAIQAITAVLVLYGLRNFMLLRDAEREADTARIAALERLAQSEERRAEAERLAVIGGLAAGVAHEVNNPLAVSTSSLRFIEREFKGAKVLLDPDVGQAFADATEGLERIQNIVHALGLFTAAKDDGGPCDLTVALREALRLATVKLRPPTRVEETIAGPLPPVPMSESRLVQVLVHLLVNAADALESGESRPAAPWVGVRVVSAPDAVRLFVEDNGPGIPEALVARVFEPFFTTKPTGKGTGLGLSLCRQQLEQSGARIRAENRSEGGARFVVEFPNPARQG